MVKIIKCGAEYNIPRSSLVKIDPAYDGVLVILRDGTELRFNMQISPQVRAIIPIVRSSTSDVIILDLDAAMNGRYDKVLTLTKRPDPVNVVTITPKPEQPTNLSNITETKTTENPTNQQAPKKKGGRPKGSGKSKK